jgi:hypothetical protein
MTLKERVDWHDRQFERHERQIASIRDLVKEGIKLVIESRKEMRELRAMQKQLINITKRGTNGHSKKGLDTQ